MNDSKEIRLTIEVPAGRPVPLNRAAFTKKLDLCGCGNPESVIAMLAAVLRAFAAHADLPDHLPMDERRKRCHERDTAIREAVGATDGDGPAVYFVLYRLDALGLVEHGGSIRFAWITPRGRRVLPAMERLAAQMAEEDASGVECAVDAPPIMEWGSDSYWTPRETP